MIVRKYGLVGFFTIRKIPVVLEIRVNSEVVQRFELRK